MPYVFRRRGLQLDRLVEQLIENGKDALALQSDLHAGEQAEEQLELPPVADASRCLSLVADAREHFLHDIRLGLVGVQDDGRDERDLERLLRQAVER